jgi:hypothetical protein
VFTAALVPGAGAGGMLLPVVYWFCFRDLPSSRLIVVGCWIGVCVLVSGLAASAAQEVFAFFFSLVGFTFGCGLANYRTHPKMTNVA